MNRPMLINPAGGLAPRIEAFHPKRADVQPVHGGLPVATRSMISKRSYHEDVVANQRGGVKVRGRKHGFRIAEHVKQSIEPLNDDVVVDAEVGIVVVLVLTSDLHDATIRQKGDRLPEPLRAPYRPDRIAFQLTE